MYVLPLGLVQDAELTPLIKQCLIYVLGVYATRQSTRPQYPHCLSAVLDHSTNASLLSRALQAIPTHDFSMLDELPKILPGWNWDKVAFSDPWWAQPRLAEEYQTCQPRPNAALDLLEEALDFFEVCLSHSKTKHHSNQSRDCGLGTKTHHFIPHTTPTSFRPGMGS